MQLGIENTKRLKKEQRNKQILPLASEMHFQLIKELTIVQRTPCLSDGFRMIFFFLKKKNIRGLLSLSVLMQLFMSALAKSHTKILHMLFFFSLLILPKKEKKN